MRQTLLEEKREETLIWVLKCHHLYRDCYCSGGGKHDTVDQLVCLRLQLRSKYRPVVFLLKLSHISICQRHIVIVEENQEIM